MSGTTTRADYHIRWMIRRDAEECVRIGSFGPCGWDVGTLLTHLRQRNCIGMVAEDSAGRIVGHMVYTLEGECGAGKLILHTLAVHPAYRRRKVGRNLLAKFAYKLNTHRRNYGVCVVPESALSAQLLLRSAGWRWVATEPAAFGAEGGYRFRLDAAAEEPDWRRKLLGG
jgi:ribosomal protein S18 acetylase RimI-like enzyme